MDENVLEHHGVKGMKWGVRKSRSSGSGLVKKKLKIARSRISKFHKSKSNQEDLSKFTSRQLQKKVNRLNLEKQYKQLTVKPKKEGVLKKSLKIYKSSPALQKKLDSMVDQLLNGKQQPKKPQTKTFNEKELERMLNKLMKDGTGKHRA